MLSLYVTRSTQKEYNNRNAYIVSTGIKLYLRFKSTTANNPIAYYNLHLHRLFEIKTIGSFAVHVY